MVLDFSFRKERTVPSRGSWSPAGLCQRPISTRAYDWKHGERRDCLTAACVVPLFVGLTHDPMRRHWREPSMSAFSGSSCKLLRLSAVASPPGAALAGDYVIALNSEGATTFKQLVKDGGELYLKPLNTRYPIRLLGDAKGVGVVREFSKKFR